MTPELRSTVKQICTVQEAVKYLRHAYDFQNYQDLLGKYFVGIYNVATHSFDVDGVEKVQYRKDTGVVTVQVTKLGPLAVCAVMQSPIPFRAWALVPDRGRGEGYLINEIIEDYERYVTNNQVNLSNSINPDGLAMSLGATSLNNDSMTNTSAFNPGSQKNRIARSRYAYFRPSGILQRAGAPEEVPQRI